MRNYLAACLAALVTGLSAPVAFAQDEPPTTEVEGITVVGRPIEEAVTAFVEQVGAAPNDRNLARWDRTVCVGVVNMTPRYAQALADQVSAVALAIGLEPGEPGCRPDVLILADSDGDALAQWMVDEEPLAFRPDLSASNRGQAALRAFQSSGAPVRWWHVSQTVSSDTGEPATGGASVRVRGASRLRSNIREDLHHIIIILDTSRIGSISFASLADYVSMIALAQVDPEADTSGYDSVLNLFAPTTTPTQRMTQWDLDYLQGLYAARPDAVTDSRQQREIVEEILRQREGQTDSPEEPSDSDRP